MAFFYNAAWTWNCLDVLVVSLQIFEELFTVAVHGYDSEGANLNLSFLRLLRVLRLVRLVRLVRVLRFIRELRTLVTSIFGSLMSLTWTITLLVLVIYVVSLFFTQVVSDNLDNVEDKEHR